VRDRGDEPVDVGLRAVDAEARAHHAAVQVREALDLLVGEVLVLRGQDLGDHLAHVRVRAEALVAHGDAEVVV
jgi:hypothetical protein